MVWYPVFDDDAHRIAMILTDETAWPLIGGVREKIESALFVPRNLAHYEEADLFAQAAFLMGRLAVAHGYENGNKRTTLAVTELFLNRNGYQLVADTAVEDLLVAVVEANSEQEEPESHYAALAVAIRDRCSSTQ